MCSNAVAAPSRPAARRWASENSRVPAVLLPPSTMEPQAGAGRRCRALRGLHLAAGTAQGSLCSLPNPAPTPAPVVTPGGRHGVRAGAGGGGR